MPTETTSGQPTSTPLTAKQAQQTVDAVAGSQKYVIAVHGIGDQFQNATIQTVVSAFGRFGGYPAAVPLGNFRSAEDNGVSAFKLPVAPGAGVQTPPWLSQVGFLEIYWADIPRELQAKGFIIEESKAWARTIVGRIHARYSRQAKNLPSAQNKNHSLLAIKDDDYLAGADALEDMIETFAVLGNLLWVAEKAGVLKFDLDKLLTTYLGDVQVVADFADQRAKILAKFKTILGALEEQIVKDGTDAEIYVVAHSEGTVVAFMAMLEAMRHPPKQPLQAVSRTDPRWQLVDADQVPPLPGWVRRIRGFMTIGSPIDKHLVLWPDLWEPIQTPHPALLPGKAPDARGAKIQWRNYYDYGDPVGFKLDTTQGWLQDHQWTDVFAFDGEHDDYGFARYLLPGAAHNDYWTDDAVFGHFLEKVVFAPDQTNHFPEPPNRTVQRVASYVIPYVLIFLLIYTGSYLLYKAMGTYTAPSRAESQAVVQAVAETAVPPILDDEIVVAEKNAAAAMDQCKPVEPDRLTPMQRLIVDVLATTALIFGMTLLARIPRLSRNAFWTAWAVILFAVGAAVYGVLGSEAIHEWHALKFLCWSWVHPFVPTWVMVHAGMVSAGGTILLAATIGGISAWVGRHDLRRWPGGNFSWLRPYLTGARPLIYFGGAQVALIVIYRIFRPDAADRHEHPLWPLVLAGLAFLYLWWLGILIFDLVFVWHRYIRHAVAQNYLTALRTVYKKEDKEARMAAAQPPASAGDDTGPQPPKFPVEA